MITKYDERVYTKPNNEVEFREVIDKVFSSMENMGNELVEFSGRMHRVQPKLVMEKFDSIITKYGFEVDARNCIHAYGIGNNNEWIIRDENLVEMGSLHCTDNMYGKVIMYVTIRGEKIKRTVLEYRGG